MASQLDYILVCLRAVTQAYQVTHIQDNVGLVKEKWSCEWHTGSSYLVARERESPLRMMNFYLALRAEFIQDSNPGTDTFSWSEQVHRANSDIHREGLQTFVNHHNQK